MLAKFVPSDAQNKLEFDLMQCDNINQYFSHLKDDNAKLMPDAFVIEGLTSKPFGFKVKDANGNKTDAFEKVRHALDQLPFSLKNNRNNYVQIRYHLVNHHPSEFDSEVDLREFMLDDDVKNYVMIDFKVAPWVIVNLYNADRKNLTVDMASFLEARDGCQNVYDTLRADYRRLSEAVTHDFIGPSLDLSNLSLDEDNDETDTKDKSIVDETGQESSTNDEADLDSNSNQNTNSDDDNSKTEQESDNEVAGSNSGENGSDSDSNQNTNSDTDDSDNEQDSDSDSNQNANSDNDDSDNEQDSDNNVVGSDSSEHESDSEAEQVPDSDDATDNDSASVDSSMNNRSDSEESAANESKDSETESESNNASNENLNSESESSSAVSSKTLSESPEADDDSQFEDKSTDQSSEGDDMPHLGMTDEVTGQNDDSSATDSQSAFAESSSEASESQNTTSKSSSASTSELPVQASQPTDSTPAVPVMREITDEVDDDEHELHRALIDALKRIDNKKTQPIQSKEQEEFYRKLVERLDKVGDVNNSSNLQLETKLQEKLLAAIDRFLATTEEQREKDRLAREAAERQAKEEALLKKEEESAKKEAGKTERQKFTSDQDELIANLLNENLSDE